MPDYRVVVARSAERELRGLPSDVRERATRSIDALASEPRPHGVKKLQGSSDLWRIRIRDYRIVYRIDDRRSLVDIIHIRHRKDIYR
ncbi:MAG: type II toxin-antitoxin system RelE family toxin [Thermoanaerobaculia bacterium]